MKKILLSIKPCFVERIFAGTKKVEYRKTKIQDSIRDALIYQSNDIKKIVGEFVIKSVISGTPEIVWNITKEYGRIDEHSFFEYFGTREIAYAYVIDKPMKYLEPIE